MIMPPGDMLDCAHAQNIASSCSFKIHFITNSTSSKEVINTHLQYENLYLSMEDVMKLIRAEDPSIYIRNIMIGIRSL